MQHGAESGYDPYNVEEQTIYGTVSFELPYERTETFYSEADIKEATVRFMPDGSLFYAAARATLSVEADAHHSHRTARKRRWGFAISGFFDILKAKQLKEETSMSKITLGKTGLVIEKNGFGCLPIQRISEQDAVYLLRKAYDGGIRFFDTARAYSDSEQKVGAAFSAMRDKIVLATKTAAQTADAFWKDLETSLCMLKTDHIDIYQFHNPAFCPKPGGEDGLYDAALEAKKQGKIRHISLTNHRLKVAHEAIDSGLYDTLQFPFSYLAGEQELELVQKCREKNMGFIAMKGMAGGLIRDGYTAAAWMQTQEDVVPIWGVQRESELDQFLRCIREGAELTDERRARIEQDRKELCGEFCRGCGYCMPCPAGIEINQCARMSLMLRRAPAADWLTEAWQQKMHRIENCLHCGKCMSKCPYGLNTPELLQANYKDYWQVLEASRTEQ